MAAVTFQSVESITIAINGQRQQTRPDLSVSALLEELAIGSDRVAVELNKSIVRKRDWAHVILKEGAELEIVEFVGGG